MPGYNLPDNVNPNDPGAPWNQVEKPTKVRLWINYNGGLEPFDVDYKYCPTEEEAVEDFFENVHVEVEYPDEN
jgi:hypothetical protein